jgi:hypothetical protein
MKSYAELYLTDTFDCPNRQRSIHRFVLCAAGKSIWRVD